MTTDARDQDERACGRIPFEAMIEVGGSLGPSFEAQAIDVSGEGMQLRTAYLPEIGQPIACRFDAGTAGNVLANGEVVWKKEQGRGGEFGIRFMDLDPNSAAALDRIVKLGGKVPMDASGGPRVRLHLEGLGSPIRGRVCGATAKDVTVGSELAFLQVGKGLELEDAESGNRRPAHIDRVEVEVDPASHIPRLVIGLSYDDVPAVPVDVAPNEAACAAAAAQTPSDGASEAATEGAGAPPEPARQEPQPTPANQEPQMKSAFARGAAQVGPAIEGLAKRAKVAFALLAARHFGPKADAADGPGPRRTTSPPPGGALHADGRKVVRAQDALEPLPAKALVLRKKHVLAGAGAGVGIALVLGWMLLHKPAHPAAPPAPPVAAAEPAPADSAATALAVAPPVAPPAAVAPVDIAPPPAATAEHRKPARATPFGNLAVTHGNVLRLKMDGPIEKINGAMQPTGFLVNIPGHRSLEAAGPLAARDARIASMKVSNDASGAALEMAFKDGVPPFLVRSRGDELQIVLASPGKLSEKTATKPQIKAAQPVARKKAGSGHPAKH